MRDLDRALTEISAIRGQLARGAVFHGYGPTTLAATGGFAVLAGIAQSVLLPDPESAPREWLSLWSVTAILAMAIIAWEAVTRARRAHSDLADAMIREAALRFAPAAIAGGALPVVLLHGAPEALWMLPGLWQILYALGAFAGAAALPRPMLAVGAWYLGCGLFVLAVAPGAAGLSPWVMALPFALGQGLAAILLLHTTRRDDDDEI